MVFSILERIQGSLTAAGPHPHRVSSIAGQAGQPKAYLPGVIKSVHRLTSLA